MGCGSSQPSIPENRHDASAEPKSSAMSPGKAGASTPGKKVAFSGAKTKSGSAGKEKVALVGSGNWGSAIATKIGLNVLSNSLFDKEVQMWVFEEYVKLEDGKWIRPARGAQPPEGKTWVDEGYEPLTEVINRLNENVIYLPGIKLPKSIIAQPDIKKCVTGATMMVFVIPHNFLAPIVPKMEVGAPSALRTHTARCVASFTWATAAHPKPPPPPFARPNRAPSCEARPRRPCANPNLNPIPIPIPSTSSALIVAFHPNQGAFAPGAVGISLIKGIEFKDSKPILISDLLAAEMKKVHRLSTLHPFASCTP